MKPELLIRAAHKSEVPIVKKIGKECELSHWSNEAYEKAIESEERDTVLLGVFDGTVAGFIHVRLITKTESIEPDNPIDAAEIAHDPRLNDKMLAGTLIQVEICNLGVLPQFRKRGIGSSLIDSCSSHFAFRCSRLEIFLEVRAANLGAIAFYNANLFRRIGYRKGYFVKPIEDAVLMSRTVRFEKT